MFGFGQKAAEQGETSGVPEPSAEPSVEPSRAAARSSTAPALGKRASSIAKFKAHTKEMAGDNNVKQKLVGAVNPKLVDYSGDKYIACLIGLAIIGGFAGLLVSNLQCTTVVNSRQDYKTTTGSWIEQKLNIESIHADSAALPAGAKRTIDMCMVYVMQDSLTKNAATDNVYAADGACILYNNEMLDAIKFPSYLKWCEDKDMLGPIQNTWRQVKRKRATDYPDKGYSETMSNDDFYMAEWDRYHPKWKCMYKSIVPAWESEDCTGFDDAQYTYCGIEKDPADGKHKSLNWTKWTDLPQGDLAPFKLSVQYVETISQEVCPSATAAIGAALGWVGLIEFGATMLFAGLAIGLGVSKPVNKKASFFNLLKGAGMADMQEQLNEIGTKELNNQFV